MRFFNRIGKRAVAFLLLAVTAFATITYSLGYYEFSFIERGEEYDDGANQDYLGSLGTGDNISDFTGVTSGTQSSTGSSPVTGGTTQGTTVEGTTTAPDHSTGGESGTDSETLPTPPSPDRFDTLAEFIEAGYSITWANYKPGMEFAEVELDVDGLDEYSHGNVKKVRMQIALNYGEGHREIPQTVTRYVERPSLEVYMGYIIVDIGRGDAISAISERFYSDTPRVSVYTSAGKFIGTFPSDEFVPAYTRDSSDRPVFVYANAYYYIDETTGKFAASDFNPDHDSRGLYFDYNPDFGKSDCNIKIYSTEQTVTESYVIDTTSYFTRYGIDSRLALQLYLAYPQFANQIAVEFQPGRYYNKLFADKLDEVIRGIASGAITTPEPETTTEPEPETTPAPEVTTEPEPETTLEPEIPVTPETTLTPETSIEPETTLESEITTVPETSTESETTTVPEPETTFAPETTTAPEITSEPEPETQPEPETTVQTETSSEPETTPEPESVTEAETTAEAPAPQARTVIANGNDDKDGNGIPDSITVNLDYTAFRFSYGVSRPKVDVSYITTNHYNYNSYVLQSISWNTAYKYARAYNFSENRAYTVDANGIVKIINTNGQSAIYLYNTYKASSGQGSYYYFQYYTEPFERDEYMLGHYYFNDGLIRMRLVERLPYKLNIYENDYEVLLDTNGNEVSVVPDGYTLVSYSDSIMLVERDGRYGYYHRDGYWVAQPIYTYAAPFIEGVGVIGYKNGVRGAIDTEGNILIPFRYTEISNSSSGVFACYNDNDGWKIFAKVSKK